MIRARPIHDKETLAGKLIRISLKQHPNNGARERFPNGILAKLEKFVES